MSGWTASPTNDPHVVDLNWRTFNHVAEIWWLHEPQHRAVVMERILDRLNAAPADCAPSPTPTWSVSEIVVEGERSIPQGWHSFQLDGHEVMAIMWFRRPTSGFAGIVQRILDALNAGRGLPAVAVPVLVRAA